ncbi:2-oxoglutarate dehydrogenase complex dihydrolipoyllysine-residue succinyltransferase [Burkholderia oklahomensis]|uniref:Dihydrolipoyllysine-residue succinyltransferase component of 2-oxoglutarate dehydrogenase complex n=5 Tax=Burkholderia oklahomensis TaxID=342113 RepID=A0AAI8B5K9_9BURK|nr:2-oxoglutarate dehydrogenase complex dihydrolipoyllysine-residue succinyltransferase [Burkholderia oklahomensis]AIO66077.1 dihydrolipoyllysine-residue succinyltransferase, E2 component of oxoglutarate dehydrogenase complex [Burkholderia oklahomensis]AJX32769.1 dihydrolipoyllysine-residue succinyltransferase, E2 component of oxoglutarate dehydrogenase complex [Burkholderia oklahomensis C6786]AOI42658.1 dihydrolipoamide succinyltransferase [Burkholderia oklahomensis EO147]AOI46151.1 dihydrolip
MAIVEVKVPQLSESVSEATMLQWKKKPGEAVAQDEILIELETDKVVLEVPAPAAGVLAQVLQNDGDTVVADQLIATIDTEAKAGAAAAAAGAAEVQPAAAPAPAAQPAAAAASSAASASPAASKLMAEKGLAAGDVAGSGRDGRITKGDVLSAGGAPKAAPAAAPAKAAAKPALPEVKVPASATTWLNDRPEQRVPMSRLRARIAERLLESQQTNAILTTFNEVNMQPVMDLRAKYKDKFEKEHGVKLGFMSFFVKAAVHALKKFPLVNASIDGNDIVYHGYFDIGIAVGSPRGLVVPILRNADQLSLAEIEKKIAEFGQKAKDGKLSIDEMTGGTFSISNGGVFGSMLSTPIINPPQSAILGVHATKERPVVENGQIVIRPINYLALSYDHRIIDGREAVLSLVAMKDALEDPARLLLDL